MQCFVQFKREHFHTFCLHINLDGHSSINEKHILINNLPEIHCTFTRRTQINHYDLLTNLKLHHDTFQLYLLKNVGIFCSMQYWHWSSLSLIQCSLVTRTAPVHSGGLLTYIRTEESGSLWTYFMGLLNVDGRVVPPKVDKWDESQAWFYTMFSSRIGLIMDHRAVAEGVLWLMFCFVFFTCTVYWAS